MSSAWGKAWGASWGKAWGTVVVDEVGDQDQPAGGHGTQPPRRSRRLVRPVAPAALEVLPAPRDEAVFMRDRGVGIDRFASLDVAGIADAAAGVSAVDIEKRDDQMDEVTAVLAVLNRSFARSGVIH